MNRLLAAALLGVFVLCGTAMPQSLISGHPKLKKAVDEHDYKTAIDQLLELEQDNTQTFTANNFDYLLARVAEADGRVALAMSNYRAVVARDSVLKGYALRHLSAIARSTGNLLMERIYLYEILAVSPDSLPAAGVNLRLAENTFETGDTRETVRLLTGGTQSRFQAPKTRQGSRAASEREGRAMLAEACLRSGYTERARGIYLDLLENVPNTAYPDDVALTAARGLDLLDGGKAGVDGKAPELNVTEHFRRADIYQFNRDFPAAKLHYDAVMAHSAERGEMAEAAFQIGRGFAQRSDFAEAVKWFERVLEQYGETKTAADALIHAASAYARVGKSKEAITRYHTFIDKYPSHENVDRAYLNIVDLLRDQGSDSDALKWCLKTQQAFAGKLAATLALFSEARIYIAREEWPAAERVLDRLGTTSDLGGSSVPGGATAPEIAFLRAFVLEQMKRYPEAIDAYLSINDGREEYFGWRATERLKLLALDEAATASLAQKTGVLSGGLNAKGAEARRKNALGLLRLTTLPDIRQKALDTLKPTLRVPPKLDVRTLAVEGSVGQQLLSLGLYDEAAPAVQADRPLDLEYTLALYWGRGDRADIGMEFIEPIWKSFPADYPIDLIPREHLELLYPAPYTDSLQRSASEMGVDPRLVLAVMRQESRFKPDAKSNAAARGLMQFISPTSMLVAGRLGRDNFRQADLYYPPTAILFGSRYLGDLFAIFPNQPDAVAAAYNAGDENMKRWLLRSRSGLPERYVPEIAYAQSKDYVYKVMANYRVYQHAYDERLRPR